MILASDGVANVGDTSADGILANISEEAGKGIQLVAVGVGLGNLNDTLLEQLADRGDGFYVYIDTTDEAEKVFVEKLSSTIQTVALDGKVEVVFNRDNVVNYRLLGYEDRAIADGSIRTNSVDGGELGSGHTSTALYEVTLASRSLPRDANIATVTVAWRDPATKANKERTAKLTAGSISPQFSEAPTYLQLGVLVAAFAEQLRDAPWGDETSFGRLADRADALSGRLDGDDAAREFVGLVDRAATLSRR